MEFWVYGFIGWVSGLVTGMIWMTAVWRHRMHELLLRRRMENEVPYRTCEGINLGPDQERYQER